MAERDPEDIFLRHRGAVLEAMLAEPAAAGSVPAESASIETAGVPNSISAEGPNTEPMTPPQPRRARAGGEPRASDRIIALLNGATPDPASEPEFVREGADPVAAHRGAGLQPGPSRPDGERTSQTAGSQMGTVTARRLLTQLKNPKIVLPVCGLLALLLVVVLITSGGDAEQDATRLPVVSPSDAPSTSQTPVSGTNSASSIIPVKSAVSHCPAGSTPGMDAFGGQPGKAWSCGRAFKIDGQVLTIELDKNYHIDSIGIVPGWDSVSAEGVDQWPKYRTVSRVSYQFDDPKTTTYTQQTLDQRTLVVTKFDPPVSTSRIVLTVLASKGDPTVNTVAISSITITGR